MDKTSCKKDNTDINSVISELVSKNKSVTDPIDYKALPISLRKRLMYQQSLQK